MGRSTAFNATLFFTALFGLLASFARTFFWLCVALFFLGSAVGVRFFLFPDSTRLDSITLTSDIGRIGLDANRRNPPPRTHAPRQTIPRHSPLRLLLLRLRPRSRRRHHLHPPILMSALLFGTGLGKV